MANLITPFETLRHSGAGKDYPTSQFCELIPQIEEEFARVCLGQELYDYLVSKLAALPSAVEWSPSTTYSIDDRAIRNGCLFVSAQNSNQGNDPLLDDGNWNEFEKFTDSGCQELWEKYLRRILALKVYSSSLTPVTWRSGAGGVVVNTGDVQGFRSGNKGEIFEIKTTALAEIERATGNMVYWLQKNYVDKNLPYKTDCTVCPTPGRRSRRWGFKY